MGIETVIFNGAGFLACTGVIVYCGSLLSILGDEIASLTGFGRVWVGLILLASVTSLPELVTGISSVAIVKSPDLAAGDVFGSCVFNLLILSMLDAKVREPLFLKVGTGHMVVALFGIILLSVAGVAIYISGITPMIFWISSTTFLLIGIYLASVWGIFSFEKSAHPSQLNSENPSPKKKARIRKVLLLYGINALVVLFSAMLLPLFAEQLASANGLGKTFFGTLFLAGATSLPELVVSFSALKRNAIDLAVGNLLGSNVFNLFILGLDDLFFLEGSLFQQISSSHLVSILITITMTAVVGLGLLFRPQKKQFWLLGLDTMAISILYLGLMIFLYHNP